MKPFFLLLCLVNVLFFFWEIHFGALTPTTDRPSGLPPVLLVEERDAARRGAAISRVLDRDAAALQRLAAPDFPAPSQPQRLAGLAGAVEKKTPPRAAVKPEAVRINCYEAGPFADDSELQRWLKGKPLASARPFSRELAVPADYQVYYPAAKDAEQTRINKMMLQAKGVTDLWMVPEGDLKGALSLGVFAEKGRAQSFREQLAARGIRAEVRQRSKTRQALFVRFGASRAMAGGVAQQRVSAAECD